MMLAKRHLAIFSNYLLTLIELYWTFVYVEWMEETFFLSFQNSVSKSFFQWIYESKNEVNSGQ